MASLVQNKNKPWLIFARDLKSEHKVNDIDKTPKPVTPEMLKNLTRVTTDIECYHDIDKKHFNFTDSEFVGIAVACNVDHNGEYKDFVTDAQAFRYMGYL